MKAVGTDRRDGNTPQRTSIAISGDNVYFDGLPLPPVEGGIWCARLSILVYRVDGSPENVGATNRAHAKRVRRHAPPPIHRFLLSLARCSWFLVLSRMKLTLGFEDLWSYRFGHA